MLGGARQTHLFLCSSMKDMFVRNYGEIDSIVISNATFFETLKAHPSLIRRIGTSKEPLKVGYFSRLSFDKGFDRFLSVAARMRSTECCFYAAGGADYFDGRIGVEHDDGLYEYRGEISGVAKWEYLTSIDVLLFPSRYASEAEPVAVIEAILSQVAVLSTGRGCLQTVLSAGVVSDENDYVDAVCKSLSVFCFDRTKLDELRRAQVADIKRASCEGKCGLQKMASIL
jgi:glycosyltransferase involved in cell wall biosynthesis